jgi:hypothetical protein
LAALTYLSYAFFLSPLFRTLARADYEPKLE